VLTDAGATVAEHDVTLDEYPLAGGEFLGREGVPKLTFPATRANGYQAMATPPTNNSPAAGASAEAPRALACGVFRGNTWPSRAGLLDETMSSAQTATQAP
jgi:hypothetical protein